MATSVRQYEAEAEAARAKLSRDLDVLRSRETLASFTDNLKSIALETKDAAIEHAQEAVQDKANSFVQQLKARAAANPAAALAIGAGLAWHFVRNPPIATALVGAGLFSLFRTKGVPYGSNADYLQQGTRRFKEQMGDVGAAAREIAADATTAISDKATDLADTISNSARELSRSAAEGVAQIGSSVAANSEAASDSARRFVHDARDVISDSARMMRQGSNSIEASEARDKLLLGVAGIAVAAALGMAVQKRIAEEVE